MNRIKHGKSLGIQGIVMEVIRNLHKLARFKYPWLKKILEEWIDFVHFFGGRGGEREEYKPIIVLEIIYWNLPREGCFKCNSDGTSKGNPSPSAGNFCIRK